MSGSIPLATLSFGALFLLGCGRIPFGPGYTDFRADLCHGCRLVQFSAHEIEISVGQSFHEDRCIPAKVVTCGHDDKFVIAKQQKLDAQGHPVRNAYQYWIVDAPEKQRYGPFTEAEFITKRKELGVPDSIKLRSKDYYRNYKPPRATVPKTQ